MTRTLHGHPLSGNTHKVRLLLGFLNLGYDEVAIDIPRGEQRQPEFLAINPMGQVPVLTDEDGTRIHDSQAILLYLGSRYASGNWWPQAAVEQGKVAQWLSFAANEVQNGLNMARLHFLLGAPVDLEAAQAIGRRSLALLDHQLSGREWLETPHPTVADCALFPYVALAPEGKVMVDDYPAVSRWMRRIRELPGFSTMPGI
ncbi:MAG TPA: glutathione S-transferase family protein [Allosphingosinicella sp.]|jgi:glutathione S-transferase|uniref:glutathione S-transferase family protein n=1 Tax=Allosphingosinicella sp. TaxID=2823234 RepID=UPI002F2AD0EF